jgi:hypothetical protein
MSTGTSPSSSLRDPNSRVPSDNESFASDGYSADMDSIYGSVECRSKHMLVCWQKLVFNIYFDGLAVNKL